MLPVADPMFVTTTLEFESFVDDFSDGNYNGWSVWQGSWSAANGYLADTSPTTARIVRASTDADSVTWFSYNNRDTAYGTSVYLRAGGVDGGSLRLELSPGNVRLVDSSIQLAWVAVSTTQNQWYDVRIKLDGNNVSLWRGIQGQTMTQLFDVDTATTLTSGRLEFRDNANAEFWFDNIRIDTPNNMGKFLHVKSDSPVIDAGDPSIGVTRRDFDDQFSPIDIDQVGTELSDPLPNNNPHDIWVDEFPTDKGFSYWWRRF